MTLTAMDIVVDRGIMAGMSDIDVTNRIESSRETIHIAEKVSRIGEQILEMTGHFQDELYIIRTMLVLRGVREIHEMPELKMKMRGHLPTLHVCSTHLHIQSAP
jgi:hypothetical protein